MTLITVPIKTYSAEPFVKLAVFQWADYDSDPTKVIDIMKDTINSMDFVKNKENTKVFVNEWWDSYVEYKWYFEFDPNGWYWLLYEVAIAQVSKKIYEAFLANGIDCPYDTKTINFESKEDQKKIQEQIQERLKQEMGTPQTPTTV